MLAVLVPAAAAGAQPLAQEWVGVEEVPLTLNVGSAPGGPDPARLQVSPGATVRLLRHRWDRAYWTPIQAGVLRGLGGEQLIFLHVQTEGGFILRAGPRALELGLGVGAGILAIGYKHTDCDGTCNIGGVGPLLSPVARLVLVDGPRVSVGVALRAAIPLHLPDGDWFGAYTARAVLFIAAVDVAIGRV